MLDEQEWREIVPLLQESIREVKRIREQTGATIAQALKSADLPALRKYRELTGFVETNINAIWHHRRSNFGPKCSGCGRLIRTHKARFCAECGRRV